MRPRGNKYQHDRLKPQHIIIILNINGSSTPIKKICHTEKKKLASRGFLGGPVFRP